MAAVAKLTGGRAYHIKDPAELPAIYIKESRLVSQSFVHDKKFHAQAALSRPGPTEGMGDLEDLYGFVRTTRRPSPLVEVPIETPKIGETNFPILAYWQYGLGKAVAFTSDARSLLRRRRITGTRTGPAPTCTSSSGSRRSITRCGRATPANFCN